MWRCFRLVWTSVFAVHGAVALSDDFSIHSDEIMQYLEQGDRLAFGNGIVDREFFYGARSWLLPRLIAGMLTFCAFSLPIQYQRLPIEQRRVSCLG